MRNLMLTAAVLGLVALLGACNKKPDTTTTGGGGGGGGGKATQPAGDGHTDEPADDHGHAHDEEFSLGSVMIDGMEVTCGQGHGIVEPGKESHLVVKLPYSDKGETVVRAWIGTSDRTMSMVGRGDYDATHDDYDIHAEAPSPLPAGAAWWIEIEKPDGTKVTGTIPMVTEMPDHG